jgi:predicted lipoprotein
MNVAPTKKILTIVISIIVVVVAFYALWAAGLVATVRPINAPKSSKPGEFGSFSEASKDQTSLVDQIWNGKLFPTVKEKAVDLDTLMSGLLTDKEGTSKKYGYKVGGPYNFLIKFEGKLTDVNTESRVGKATMDVPLKSTTKPSIILQIGPIIQGYSIRDAVGFITFEQFTNQIEFADVSDQINTRLYDQVLKKIDFKGSVGKTLSVYGAITMDDPAKLVVTPVIVDIK